MDADLAELMTRKLDELDDILVAAEEDDEPPLDEGAEKGARKGRKARKAMSHDDDDDDEPRKAGMDDDDEDDDDDDEDFKIAKKAKKSRKARKAMGTEGGEEKDAKIASLTAALNKAINHLTIEKAKPMIEQMLSARANTMSQEQLTAFQNKLHNMSFKEIKERYNEDAPIINNGAATTEPLAASLPFNGAAAVSADAKSLEELFE